MFKKILLSTDGSGHSFRAAKYAVNLAKMYDGTIDLIYAIDETTSKTDVLSNRSKHEIEKKRKERFADTIQLLDNEQIKYEMHFLHGDPGPTIVKFANKEGYDCVIVGSRGLNQLQTLVLGSVSHKIVKRVNAPVLVVK